MNQKRKILTVLALAAFSAIIFFHYYSLDYKLPYEKTYLIPKKATGDINAPTQQDWFSRNAPIRTATPVSFDDLIPPSTPPKKRITAAEFYKISYKDRQNAPNVPNEWVRVKFPAIGPYFSSYPGIEDVRMLARSKSGRSL